MKKGDFIFVLDKKDNQPYKCKIVQVEDDKIKIHYHKWNNSHDEWLEKDSPSVSLDVDEPSQAVF